MARTIYGNHEKFLDTYYRPYPGKRRRGRGRGRRGVERGKEGEEKREERRRRGRRGGKVHRRSKVEG